MNVEPSGLKVAVLPAEGPGEVRDWSDVVESSRGTGEAFVPCVPPLSDLDGAVAPGTGAGVELGVGAELPLVPALVLPDGCGLVLVPIALPAPVFAPPGVLELDTVAEPLAVAPGELPAELAKSTAACTPTPLFCAAPIGAVARFSDKLSSELPLAVEGCPVEASFPAPMEMLASALTVAPTRGTARLT
jgi:hypothetical protein